MQCENCGSELLENKKFCTICGKKNKHKIKKEKIIHTKVGRLTFFNKYSLKKVRRNILTASVTLFIAAFVNLLYVFKISNYLIIDTIMCLIFGILIFIFQSRIISILSVIYVLVSILIGFYEFGRISGILVLVAVVVGVKGTKAFKKLWVEYQQNPSAYINKHEKNNFGGRVRVKP